MPLFDRMGVDDPVGASATHGIAGIWGVFAVGLFADNPIPLGTTRGRSGLFKGGGWYLLGVQSLSFLCLACWGLCSTFLLLWIIDKIIPIRLDANEELLGADIMEHRIRHTQIGISRAISALAPLKVDLKGIAGIQPIGINPGHEKNIEELRAAEEKLNQWQSYLDHVTPQKTSRIKRSESADNIQLSTIKKTNVRNIFMKRFKSMKIKNNQRTDSFIAGSGFYQRKNDIPTVSNHTNDTQLKGETNFAWID